MGMQLSDQWLGNGWPNAGIASRIVLQQQSMLHEFHYIRD